MNGSREYSFDTAKYLGDKKNSAGIYDQSSRGCLYSPFTLQVLEIEKLLLVGFQGDENYMEVELQSLGDDFGKGAVVILYHKEGNVDVYYSDETHFRPEMYAWGHNWHIIGKTDIEARLAVSDRGVDAGLKMTDRFGHVLEYNIKEDASSRAIAHLLAPLGYYLQSDPGYFPFIYLMSCAPVNRDGTTVNIAVDGKPRTPSEIPVPIQGQRKYHSRSSVSPFIGLWNRRTRGALPPLDVSQMTDGNPTPDGITYTLAETAGHPEIVRILSRSENHSVHFHFSPPIPDLFCLKSGAKTKGRFTGGADTNKGVMGGAYTVKRDGNRIDVTLKPSKGWQPVPGRLWLKSYTWTATMTVGDDGVAMDSRWTIKTSGLHEFFKHK